jgi:hypothetical protein
MPGCSTTVALAVADGTGDWRADGGATVGLALENGVALPATAVAGALPPGLFVDVVTVVSQFVESTARTRSTTARIDGASLRDDAPRSLVLRQLGVLAVRLTDAALVAAAV